MSDTIAWGILGCGAIARKFAQGLRDVPNARLHAVGARNLASAREFGAEYGITRCHGDYMALVNDPTVDVIYIATPHVFHAAQTRLCLEAGKAVLCEKPFTLNATEAADVIALARARGLFLMEAMWSRFLPAMVEAKKIALSGELGALLHAHAAFGFNMQLGPDHRVNDPQLGGGALLDLGIYPLSLAAHFLGPIADVRTLATIGETGVDVQTGFTARHQQGGISTGFCSMRANTAAGAIVSGTHGHLRIHTPFYKAERLTVVPDSGPARMLELPHLGNGYTHEAIEVGRCLRAGLIESPVMPLDQSLVLMQTMDTMREQFGLHYPGE